MTQPLKCRKIKASSGFYRNEAVGGSTPPISSKEDRKAQGFAVFSLKNQGFADLFISFHKIHNYEEDCIRFMSLTDLSVKNQLK